jgi:hypothetical protein
MHLIKISKRKFHCDICKVHQIFFFILSIYIYIYIYIYILIFSVGTMLCSTFNSVMLAPGKLLTAPNLQTLNLNGIFR